MKITLISVIVLCHNTIGIDLCIQSIIPQLQSGDELLLIDDHSDDCFWKGIILELPACGRVIHVPDPGHNRSQNRNIGARVARNPILVFMDGDIIVSEHALAHLREAFAYNINIAYVGTEHGMKFDLQQAQLFYGIDDYLSYLASPHERERLYHAPLFSDWRGADLSDAKDVPYFWLRFYTSFCAVLSKAFWEAGAFDESFSSWGAEDVDLGYRLSQVGRIGYLSQIHVIHVPHSRDSFQNELTNRRNTYYMLGKYLNWYFESLVVFGSTPSMLRTLEAVLQQINTIILSPLHISPMPNTLYIDAPAKVVWFEDTLVEVCPDMIGMAIPKRNQHFDRVIISDHIFLYPAIIITRILQEALRVGKEVEIHKSGDYVRISWNNIASINGIPFPRICKYAHEIFDFSFIAKGERIWTVHSNVYGYSPDPWNTSDKLLHTNEASAVLINLSSMPDGEISQQFIKLTGREILAVYHFSPKFDKEGHNCLLCESIPKDFARMNTTFVYCVNDLSRVSDTKQWIYFRPQAKEETMFDINHNIGKMKNH